MKKTFLLILILIMSISLFAQEAETVAEENKLLADSTVVVEEVKALTEEERLCKKAAEDILGIYDKYDGERDFKMLFPRVKEFVVNFYKEFPDTTPEVITELEKKYNNREKFTDYENRVFVAYKGLKESIYDEISRFVSLKNFYWGYIDDELADDIKEIAKTLGNLSRRKQDELLKEQEEYVQEVLDEKRKFDRQLDSLKAMSDIKVVDDLIEDEKYNKEMMELEFGKNDINSQELLDKLDKHIADKILAYIDDKKDELIDQKRKDIKDIREYWVQEKGQTLFDILTYESRRLDKVVGDYLLPLEENRNINMFDIDDDFIQSIRNSDNGYEEKFKIQLKNKYYSGLTGKFGFYLQYDHKPSFRPFRRNVLVGTILFMILFIFIFIRVKRNKDKMFIRRIAGLDAIDDAIGRATEMGKPIVYDSGIGGYTNIDTIASMLILRSVAKKVAEFKAEIYFPAHDPIIMQIAEEMIASGFLDAGYPEDHKKDNIFFLAADQFAYAAGIAGLLARKKPATAFHFGYYAAESLLISEAGFTAGAIQVAGTTAVSQLPFFIAACDYTLIGEELYAAAAYISKDSQILTNLKLSDFAKLVLGLLFVLGTILLTINSEWTFIQDLIITR